MKRLPVIMRRSVRRLSPFIALLSLLLEVTPLHAAWNRAPETIEQHATWIYTPSTAMSNGKRGLFIVLHGCAQTHDQLRAFGNIEKTAEANAMVVALPSVGDKVFFGNPSAKCWDYDGANDTQGHIRDITRLAETLRARPVLGIDPSHVYIAGLSSGAALSLAIACHAPDVFAGVGAIAGPSVGSSQFNALAEASSIPPSNVNAAVSKCRSLAGPRMPWLATQIAIIASGEMDLNGPSERYRFSALSDRDRVAHSGQLALVSVKWNADNVAALRILYGTGEPGEPQAVQSGLGTQRIAAKDNRPRIAFLTLRDIGHAWPAGGNAAHASAAGLWIARGGLDFMDYAAGWFIPNNLRAGMPPGSLPATSAERCFTDNNFNQVQQGRAVFCNLGFICAKGSGENLGLFNVFIVSSVEEGPPGFFRKGICR